MRPARENIGKTLLVAVKSAWSRCSRPCRQRGPATLRVAAGWCHGTVNPTAEQLSKEGSTTRLEQGSDGIRCEGEQGELGLTVFVLCVGDNTCAICHFLPPTSPSTLPSTSSLPAHVFPLVPACMSPAQALTKIDLATNLARAFPGPASFPKLFLGIHPSMINVLDTLACASVLTSWYVLFVLAFRGSVHPSFHFLTFHFSATFSRNFIWYGAACCGHLQGT